MTTQHDCTKCDSRFESHAALHSHLLSGIHRTATTFCPFCGRKFLKASVLIAHLESGHCPGAPGLNHHNILWLLRNCDIHGVLLKYSLAWIRFVDHGREPSTQETAHRCFTCFQSFETRHDLEWHLLFPIDQARSGRLKFYRCPDMTNRCEKHFVSLADLFKHLESNSCWDMGFDRVQMIQRHLTWMFWGWGMRAM
ncbi:hypothetical protein POX_d06068 [Penicillium oxalicum]|uniref:C2H2-type domain-containing protein n=1 Tax=Penicillium oxalicum (strain 114-2 / CGMCC 5302) TaxID=933388 RepID=S7ZN20_PENO1|nr:hypothetical protein POX_d06068 [Penicillium oxalicum]EPS31739.1 hypothetical protein PDE_06696 [Penicillium oxalicum 114-2]KAI2790549.1 hypothetical protein POX_d06068 [Penicillium oxalicum]